MIDSSIHQSLIKESMKMLISTKSVNQPKDSVKQAKSQFHQPIG